MRNGLLSVRTFCTFRNPISDFGKIESVMVILGDANEDIITNNHDFVQGDNILSVLLCK